MNDLSNVFKVEVSVNGKVKYGHTHRVSGAMSQNAKYSESHWAIESVEMLLKRMKVEAGLDVEDNPDKSGAV